MEALLLAGGKGTRLLPYTQILPKPLLPVGGIPIAEHSLVRLKEAGCSKVYLSTGYLASYIKLYFGNGEKWGIPIEYIDEDSPLGTAGPLSKLNFDQSILLLNGDILSLVDLQSFYQFHIKSGASLTILSQQKQIPISFGSLQTEGDKVIGITEKPTFNFRISAGMYVIHPEVKTYLTKEYQDMPALIQNLLGDGKLVNHYATDALWMDLGKPEDLLAANQLVQEKEWLQKRGMRDE